jgi:hypothetical protein
VATVARTLKLASKNVDLDETESAEGSFKVSESQGCNDKTDQQFDKEYLETLKP